MVEAAATTRRPAEERRESILDAALIEFAAKGLHGTSTEDIARRAGISQPYVFRLFGTKKKLFAEACRRCMREVRRGHGGRGRAASRARRRSHAMGEAYIELLEADPRRLMLQMHMYAACGEPEIREVARRGLRRARSFRRAGISGESRQADLAVLRARAC